MKRLITPAALLLALSFTAFASEAAEHREPSIIYLWVNFGILAAGLAFLAIRSGGPFFAQRTRDINVALDAASRVKAEAERQIAEITHRISNLDTDLAAMKAAARQEMAHERERSSRETESLKTKMSANAEQEIHSAAQAAEFELRSRAAQLAFELAERKFRARMSAQVQSGLVNGFVAELHGLSQTEQRG